MNTTQRNQQFMGEGVGETLTTHTAVWTGSPVVTAAVAQHNTNCTDIRDWQVKQNSAFSILGLTRNKKLIRELLVIDLLKISGAIKAWGAETGQWEIVESVNFSASQLEKMSATDFITTAQTIHDVAATNSGDIIPYGVTVAMNTTLQADINAFKTANTRGKAAKAEVKTATENLQLACKKMMSHLKDVMDNILKQYITSPFYKAYRNSRKIYNYNADTTGIRGRISDASNGEIITNGLLEIIYTGRTETLAINSRGEYHRKRLELTNCTLRIRVPHYTTAEFNVPLKKNEITVFDIQMIPEPAQTVSNTSNPNGTVTAQ